METHHLLKFVKQSELEARRGKPDDIQKKSG